MKGAVFIVTPGGVKEQGGMGRLASYVVDHWTAQGGGPAFRVIDPWGPRSLLLMPFYFLAALAVVAWNALLGRIALLHVHMSSWGSALRKGVFVHLGALFGIPVILHMHAGDFIIFFNRLPRFSQYFLKNMIRRADRVVVLSEGWRRLLLDRLGLEPNKVVVLPNALPAPRAWAPPGGGCGDAPCEIVFLGRLEAAKGVPELLEALASPDLRGLPWHASLVGPGDPTPYRERAAALGVNHKLSFPGWEEEEQVKARLCRSDVFVLPSHFEGLSMALLEALAHGLAVVATRVGANEEVIRHEETGLLISVGDVEALAAALRQVIENRPFRHRLQSAGRAMFNESFEISAYCRKLNGLYDSVLDGR